MRSSRTPLCAGDVTVGSELGKGSTFTMSSPITRLPLSVTIAMSLPSVLTPMFSRAQSERGKDGR